MAQPYVNEDCNRDPKGDSQDDRNVGHGCAEQLVHWRLARLAGAVFDDKAVPHADSAVRHIKMS